MRLLSMIVIPHLMQLACCLYSCLLFLQAAAGSAIVLSLWATVAKTKLQGSRRKSPEGASSVQI